MIPVKRVAGEGEVTPVEMGMTVSLENRVGTEEGDQMVPPVLRDDVVPPTGDTPVKRYKTRNRSNFVNNQSELVI